MNAEMKTVNIPFFPGFYESFLSFEIDQAIEQERESEEYSQYAPYDVAEVFWNHINYQEIYPRVAEAWVNELSDILEEIAEELGAPPHLAKPYLKYLRMVSPREYNFGTDKVDALVSSTLVEWMLAKTSHTTLAKVCKERHTSRDGFISFYNPDYRLWGPVNNWDHNQLGTLLLAFFEDHGEEELEEIEERILDRLRDRGAFYQVVTSNIDYDAIESDLNPPEMTNAKETNIEEGFEFNGTYLVPAPRPGSIGCEGCYLEEVPYEVCEFVPCVPDRRADGQNVIYIAKE
jgi:hypothetical protein